MSMCLYDSWIYWQLECKAECPSILLTHNNTCWSNCPEDVYEDSELMLCVDKNTCHNSGKFLQKDQCVKDCGDLLANPVFPASCTEKCQDGYYLDLLTTPGELICTKCQAPCEYCTSKIDCLSCVTHNFLIRGRCEECSANCSTCVNGKFKCSTCVENHWLTKNNSCEVCSSNCTTCNPLTGQCTGCKDDKYLNGTECILCESPCLNCSTKTSCLSCVAGNQLFGDICCADGLTLINGTCIPCLTPCKTCGLN